MDSSPCESPYLEKTLDRNINASLFKNITADFGESDDDLPATQPVDQRILKDVVAYVEVRTNTENRSRAVIRELLSLGASVEPKLTSEVTHVVFKDGKKSTRDKALKKGLHLVTVLWVDSCKNQQEHVSERLFPVILPEQNRTPIFIGRLKKAKSMQPKDFEEEVASSGDRGVRKRRRKELADRWKTLQTPTPESNRLILAQETQPRTPEETISPNITIPDTPPSMREAQASKPVRVLQNTMEGSITSITESPECSQNAATPLQRKLFYSEKNSSSQQTSPDLNSPLVDRVPKQAVFKPKLKRKLLSTVEGSPNPFLVVPAKGEKIIEKKVQLLTPQTLLEKGKKAKETTPTGSGEAKGKKSRKRKSCLLSSDSEDSAKIVKKQKRVFSPDGAEKSPNKNRTDCEVVQTDSVGNTCDTDVSEKAVKSVPRQQRDIPNVKSILKSGRKTTSVKPLPSEKSHQQRNIKASIKGLTPGSSVTLESHIDLEKELGKTSVEDGVGDSPEIGSEPIPKRRSRRSIAGVSECQNKSSSNVGDPAVGKGVVPKKGRRKSLATLAELKSTGVSTNREISTSKQSSDQKQAGELPQEKRDNEKEDKQEKVPRRSRRSMVIVANDIDNVQTKDKVPADFSRVADQKQAEPVPQLECDNSKKKEDKLGNVPQRRSRRSMGIVPNDIVTEKIVDRDITKVESLPSRNSDASKDKEDNQEKVPPRRSRRSLGVCPNISETPKTSKGRRKSLVPSSSSRSPILSASTSLEKNEKSSAEVPNVGNKNVPTVGAQSKAISKDKRLGDKLNTSKEKIAIGGDDCSSDKKSILKTKDSKKTLSVSEPMSRRQKVRTSADVSTSESENDTSGLSSQSSSFAQLVKSRRSTDEFLVPRLNSSRETQKKSKISNLNSSTSGNDENSSVSDADNKTRRKKKTKVSFSGVKEKPKNTLVMTSLHRHEQDVVISVVKKLGGFSLSDSVSDSTTHVICGGERRTLNILHGIARGCWVLSKEWVFKSLEANHWLEEEPYEVTDFFPSAQVARLERVTCEGRYQQDLFSDQGLIFVSEQSCPPTQHVVDLIKICGGQVTFCIRKANICVGRTSKTCVSTVSEQWVLDSITEHKVLPLPGYLITYGERFDRESSPEF